MLVTKMKQFAMMRARQEEECQELRRVIKYMNEMQGKYLAVMERKQNLMSEAQEDLRKKIFQEIRDLDEKISGEELELLEKKQIMGEMSKERRIAEVEEGRGTVVAGSGVNRKAIAGSRSSEKGQRTFSVKERGRRKSKGTNATVAVGSGVTGMTAAGSGARSSDMEGN